MNETNSAAAQDVLQRAADEGRLPALMDAYLLSCRLGDGEESGSSKKRERSFPNLAGFCRHLGCGVSSADRLRHSHPELYARLCAILEDEALNASISPNLLSAYLKRRLGYAEEKETAAVSTSCEQLRLVFEHDILEDGK